jgi:dipeptidyl aminopeptidase/acylaminoacyl peptidase
MRPFVTCPVLVVAAVVLAHAPAAVRAQDSTARRPFAPTDVYRVVTVGAPTLSPDGRRVAFTVTRVDEGRNRRHSEVWVASTGLGGEPARLSWPDSESTAPRYLPDGRLVFTVGGPGGRPRTYVVRGEAGEERPVLVTGLPPAGASWSRDGRLAVWADSVVPTADSARGEFSPPDSAMRLPARGDTARSDSAGRAAAGAGEGRAGAMAAAPYGAVTRPLDATRFDGRHVVDFPYKDNDRGFVANRADARRWRPTQLWAATAGDTARRQLTAAPYSHRDAALSPDGRAVAFVADTALRPDSVVQAERDSIARLPYDRRRDDAGPQRSELFVRPLGGASRAGSPRSGREARPRVGPRREDIAFLWQPARTKSTTLATVDVATGRVRNLLADVTWEPETFDVGQRAAADRHGAGGRAHGMFRIGSGGGGAREVLAGRRRLSGFALRPRPARGRVRVDEA